MEIVSFVRVIYVGPYECYLRWIHTFVTETDNFLPFSAIIYIYVHDL